MGPYPLDMGLHCVGVPGPTQAWPLDIKRHCTRPLPQWKIIGIISTLDEKDIFMQVETQATRDLIEYIQVFS